MFIGFTCYFSFNLELKPIPSQSLNIRPRYVCSSAFKSEKSGSPYFTFVILYIVVGDFLLLEILSFSY